MRVKFNPYRRKDGSWMLYANNDRRVSVGISEDRGMPAPYGKSTTQGQRKLMEEIPNAVANGIRVEMDGEPIFSKHTEGKARLCVGDLYITDVGEIGGVSTGSDGAFLVTEDGNVIDISFWISTEENEVGD